MFAEWQTMLQMLLNFLAVLNARSSFTTFTSAVDIPKEQDSRRICQLKCTQKEVKHEEN